MIAIEFVDGTELRLLGTLYDYDLSDTHFVIKTKDDDIWISKVEVKMMKEPRDVSI